MRDSPVGREKVKPADKPSKQLRDDCGKDSTKTIVRFPLSLSILFGAVSIACAAILIPVIMFECGNIWEELDSSMHHFRMMQDKIWSDIVELSDDESKRFRRQYSPMLPRVALAVRKDRLGNSDRDEEDEEEDDFVHRDLSYSGRYHAYDPDVNRDIPSSNNGFQQQPPDSISPPGFAIPFDREYDEYDNTDEGFEEGFGFDGSLDPFSKSFSESAPEISSPGSSLPGGIFAPPSGSRPSSQAPGFVAQPPGSNVRMKIPVRSPQAGGFGSSAFSERREPGILPSAEQLPLPNRQGSRSPPGILPTRSRRPPAALPRSRDNSGIRSNQRSRSGAPAPGIRPNRNQGLPRSRFGLRDRGSGGGGNRQIGGANWNLRPGPSPPGGGLLPRTSAVIRRGSVAKAPAPGFVPQPPGPDAGRSRPSTSNIFKTARRPSSDRRNRERTEASLQPPGIFRSRNRESQGSRIPGFAAERPAGRIPPSPPPGFVRPPGVILPASGSSLSSVNSKVDSESRFRVEEGVDVSGILVPSERSPQPRGELPPAPPPSFVGPPGSRGNQRPPVRAPAPPRSTEGISVPSTGLKTPERPSEERSRGSPYYPGTEVEDKPIPSGPAIDSEPSPSRRVPSGPSSVPGYQEIPGFEYQQPGRETEDSPKTRNRSRPPSPENPGSSQPGSRIPSSPSSVSSSSGNSRPGLRSSNPGTNRVPDRGGPSGPSLNSRKRPPPPNYQPKCQCSRQAQNKCPAGRKGPKGTPGSPGRPGAPGATGRRGYDAESVTASTAKVCITCPQGRAGYKGPSGEDGAPGRIGYPGGAGSYGRDGKPGPKGPRGKQGPPGQRGRQGFKGRDAPVSYILKGIKGAPGPRGERGNKGRSGYSGPRGYPGPSGEEGVEGPPGGQGPIGPEGRQGRQGYSGDMQQDSAKKKREDKKRRSRSKCRSPSLPRMRERKTGRSTSVDTPMRKVNMELRLNQPNHRKASRMSSDVVSIASSQDSPNASFIRGTDYRKLPKPLVVDPGPKAKKGQSEQRESTPNSPPSVRLYESRKKMKDRDDTVSLDSSQSDQSNKSRSVDFHRNRKKKGIITNGDVTRDKSSCAAHSPTKKAPPAPPLLRRDSLSSYKRVTFRYQESQSVVIPSKTGTPLKPPSPNPGSSSPTARGVLLQKYPLAERGSAGRLLPILEKRTKHLSLNLKNPHNDDNLNANRTEHRSQATTVTANHSRSSHNNNNDYGDFTTSLAGDSGEGNATLPKSSSPSTFFGFRHFLGESRPQLQSLETESGLAGTASVSVVQGTDCARRRRQRPGSFPLPTRSPYRPLLPPEEEDPADLEGEGPLLRAAVPGDPTNPRLTALHKLRRIIRKLIVENRRRRILQNLLLTSSLEDRRAKEASAVELPLLEPSPAPTNTYSRQVAKGNSRSLVREVEQGQGEVENNHMTPSNDPVKSRLRRMKNEELKVSLQNVENEILEESVGGIVSRDNSQLQSVVLRNGSKSQGCKTKMGRAARVVSMINPGTKKTFRSEGNPVLRRKSTTDRRVECNNNEIPSDGPCSSSYAIFSPRQEYFPVQSFVSAETQKSKKRSTGSGRKEGDTVWRNPWYQEGRRAEESSQIPYHSAPSTPTLSSSAIDLSYREDSSQLEDLSEISFTSPSKRPLIKIASGNRGAQGGKTSKKGALKRHWSFLNWKF